ncbi:hypothetical protein ACJU26_13080 [Acidithiobacillus sp. M4-SHS-6]|uniref:hypothetical protein n=1 Tax=Acidithiobacillus sp. M4-SHS-6 TaxID=3383024 RepID=UPI0039BE0699
MSKTWHHAMLCLITLSGVTLLSGTATAGDADNYLQPPILGWKTPPHAAPLPMAAPPAPQTPSTVAAPAAQPAVTPIPHPAPVEAQHGIPLAPAKPAVSVVIHHPVAQPPARPAYPNAVRKLFVFQADGQHAGHFQPITGAEAAKSYKAYLKSFGQAQSSASAPADTNPMAASSSISGSQYPGMQP